MGVRRVRLASLAADERAEIEAIVGEAAAARPAITGAFVSDEGDVMAWYLLAAIVALCGLVALVILALTDPYAGARLELPTNLPGLVNAPVVPGLTVCVGVLVYAGLVFARVHGRHGWMATSFGVVRLRGDRVVLLRYGDVTAATRRRVRSGRQAFFVLDLVAADGTTLTTYAARIMDTILARVPAQRASV